MMEPEQEKEAARAPVAAESRATAATALQKQTLMLPGNLVKLVMRPPSFFWQGMGAVLKDGSEDVVHPTIERRFPCGRNLGHPQQLGFPPISDKAANGWVTRARLKKLSLVD